MKSLLEKLLDVRNFGEGITFDPNYDVKNQLFKKVLVAKEYGFYPKYVSLFEVDCKKLKERLGEFWYRNELARYMLYRKFNIKDLRLKCDNFPVSECDSSAYSMRLIFKNDGSKEKKIMQPWLVVDKNGKESFFADTLTPAWTILRFLLEYCSMVDKNEIFEEDIYEDLEGHKLFNFKIPDAELEIISKTIAEEIGTKNYEVALCEYIINNIVSVIDLFEKNLGELKGLYEFLTLTHSGSGCNFAIVPKGLMNRSRDPFINRKVDFETELPNAGRVWDMIDIPIFLIHRWYMNNHGNEVNCLKYIEEHDIEIMLLGKFKKENNELRNVKNWLNYYKGKGGYDTFIEAYHLEPFVYEKDSEENKLLEGIAKCDTTYSKKYGFAKELFKGHLYKYDFKDGIENAKPKDICKVNSLEEDFKLMGYVNGIDDFKQVFKNFKEMAGKRKQVLS